MTKFEKGLLAVIVVAVVIAASTIALAALNVTYHMSAPTISQNLIISTDSSGTSIIDPSAYDWNNQGVVVTNGSSIQVYAKNVGNVQLNVTVAGVSESNCHVAYEPANFLLDANETQLITMTFSLVPSNSTATWSFAVAA